MNTCSTPTCSTNAIVVPVYGQAAITVKNSLDEIQSGLNVYTFNGTTYTGFSAATNICAVPACTTAQITAAVFDLVTVTDSAGTVQPNLPVYVFKGSTYTGFNGTSDANGQVTLNLPQGNYCFRADLHGAQYFSGAENTCSVPTCTTVSVVTPVYGQVTIMAQSGAGVGQADLPVNVFDGTTYTA